MKRQMCDSDAFLLPPLNYALKSPFWTLEDQNLISSSFTLKSSRIGRLGGGAEQMIKDLLSAPAMIPGFWDHLGSWLSGGDCISHCLSPALSLAK